MILMKKYDINEGGQSFHGSLICWKPIKAILPYILFKIIISKLF